MRDIIRFKGGLGNQMFQYSLLESLRSRGRNVAGSLGFYSKHPELMPYVLDSVFDHIQFDRVSEEEFENIDSAWKEIKSDPQRLETFKKDTPNRFFWIDDENGFEPEIFNTKHCAFVGYWQSYKYFTGVEERLRYSFAFKEVMPTSVMELSRTMKECVSVHIRRGDYLQALYAGICTENYYHQAINIMRDLYPGIRFAFFSDDIDWVKRNFVNKEYLYVEGKDIANYQDWHDMYLMTQGRGNIIANSTFSWWGAWLNPASDKTVIAPSGWLNGHDCRDICPLEWIRI